MWLWWAVSWSNARWGNSWRYLRNWCIRRRCPESRPAWGRNTSTCNIYAKTPHQSTPSIARNCNSSCIAKLGWPSRKREICPGSRPIDRATRATRGSRRESRRDANERRRRSIKWRRFRWSRMGGICRGTAERGTIMITRGIDSAKLTGSMKNSAKADALYLREGRLRD